MARLLTTSQQTSFVPFINIDRILLESGQRDLVRLRLDLSIDDVLDNPDKSWLLQEDYRKFLKIAIIQSNSQKTTDLIANKSISQIMKNSGDYIQYEFWLNDALPDFNKDKYLVDPLVADNQGLVYRVPFVLPDNIIIQLDLKDHLSIFAYAYVDLAALSKSRGLNFPAGTFTDKTLGEISGEAVVRKGSISLESYLFLTSGKDGEQIWTGPVAKSKDGKSYYAPNTSPLKVLKRVSTPNYKVQDLRRREITEAESPKLFLAKEALYGVQESLKNGQFLNLGVKTENYYSQGETSRSDAGVVSFIFDINFENLLKDNTIFWPLLERPARKKILRNSRISEMKITRRRVKKQTTASSLGTTIDDISIFDVNEAPELIALNGESRNIRFLTKKLYYGHLSAGDRKKDNFIGCVGEMRKNTKKVSPDPVRRFISVDNSLIKKTYGLYQYGITMQIEDGTVIFLQDSLKKITSALTVLRNYYTISTSVNFYDAFNRKFKRKLSKFYAANGQRPWQAGIWAYVEVLSDFMDLGLPKRSAIIKELTAISNPVLGTPEGIMALINLLLNFETLIYEMLVGKVKVSDQQIDGSLSRIYNNNNYEKFMVVCEHFFNSTVDADVVASDGHKVLPTNTPILYLKDFLNRSKEEALKYFTNDNPKDIEKGLGKVPGLNDENKGISNLSDSFYTYFTPQSITAGGNKLELQNKGTAIWQNGRYESFTSYLMSAPPGPKPTLPPFSIETKGTTSTLALMEKLLGSYSVTITPTMLENKDTKETKPTIPPSCDNDFSVTGPRPEKTAYSPTLSKGLTTIGSIFTSAASNKALEPSPSLSMPNFNLASNENLVDTKIRKSKLKTGQLEGLPNQISSLFLSKSPAVVNNWQEYEKDGIDFPSSEKTNLMFLYNYSTLFKLEYQDGYEKDKLGKILIKQPIWKSFSENTLDRVTTGEALLCRVEKYENDEIGIIHHDILDLPVIDKYFFFVKNKTTLKRLETSADPHSSPDELRKEDTLRSLATAPFSKSLVARKK